MQVTRKRLFNTIQDMKGKIRVFCRVRPMLDFESDRGQKIAISIPDELTAAHFWKDEKKQREYPFDQVRPARLRRARCTTCGETNPIPPMLNALGWGSGNLGRGLLYRH